MTIRLMQFYAGSAIVNSFE